MTTTPTGTGAVPWTLDRGRPRGEMGYLPGLDGIRALAVIGVLLYQGILTMTPLIFNAVLKVDMSDVIRIIVSNGMILYALTRKTKVLK